MIHLRTVAAISVLLICAPARAQPIVPDKWHWIWVVPDYRKGWRTFEGDASVLRGGKRFEVTLDGVAPDEQPSLKLVGTIAGKSVTATGRLLGTDASPERYIGFVESGRTKVTDASGGWGFDRIVLHAGPAFVGLYRDVRSTH